MGFCKKWKVNPNYVGPYKLFKRVGKVAYELDFLAEFATLHRLPHLTLEEMYG